MIRFIKKYYSTLLCLLLVGFVIAKKKPIWLNSYKQKGADFNSVVVTNLNGNTEKLPQLGKNAVYIFWATWCKPCHLQLNMFKKSVESGELSGNSIIAVNLGEPVEVVRSFQKKQSYPFKVVMTPPGVAWHHFNVMVTPTIAYVSKSGKINEFSSGLSPLAVFQSKKFLKY